METCTLWIPNVGRKEKKAWKKARRKIKDLQSFKDMKWRVETYTYWPDLKDPEGSPDRKILTGWLLYEKYEDVPKGAALVPISH